MSQYNQSSAPQNGSNKKNSTILYWVVIVILLASCLYLFMSKQQMAKENSDALLQKQQTIDSVKTDRASLQADFDAASAKIDQLASQNAKLDSALQGDKVEMAKLQGQIKAILTKKNATQAELTKARDMITSLTDKTKQYEARIAELEKEIRAGLEQALKAGDAARRKPGATSLDAVEAAIRVLEDSPWFNAGRGAVFKWRASAA